jgi:hypothetical protein
VRLALSRLLAISAASLATLFAFPAQAQNIQFHGLIELNASSRGPAFDVNGLSMGDSPFDPWGLRLFAEGAVSPKLSVFTQAVLHDPSGPYVEGAYVVFNPTVSRDFHLMAGKIPWPIGTYAARSYSDKNPLIGKPLMYQYATSLNWYRIPPNADAIIAAGGTGQGGSGYGGGGRGMAVVDDSYWDTGAVITGSARPIEYALGGTTGTPGWGNTGEDENRGKTALGRLGIAPIPGLRAGVSGAYGPYLVEDLDPYLPTNRTANDYHQKLVMADADLESGYGILRAEGYSNAWESPNVGDLRVHGGYVEAQWTLMPGLIFASRGEIMRFSSLRDSSGVDHPWDHDRDRIESGLCYRPERDLRIKAVWQVNQEHSSPGAPAKRYDMLALGISASF